MVETALWGTKVLGFPPDDTDLQLFLLFLAVTSLQVVSQLLHLHYYKTCKLKDMVTLLEGWCIPAVGGN